MLLSSHTTSQSLDFYQHRLIALSIFKCTQMESYSVASFASGLFQSKLYLWASPMLFACRNSSFFLFAALYSFGWICHKLFTHSTVNEYLDCFWFGAIMERVCHEYFLSHLLVHVCRHFCSTYPQEWNCWFISDPARQLSKMLLSFHTPIAILRVPLLTSLPTLDIRLFFHLSHSSAVQCYLTEL